VFDITSALDEIYVLSPTASTKTKAGIAMPPRQVLAGRSLNSEADLDTSFSASPSERQRNNFARIVGI